MNRRVLCVRIQSRNRPPARGGRPAPDRSSDSDGSSQTVAVTPNLLKRLARWCRRYSPLVGIAESETADTLALDVTGCTHLFGGEARMVRSLLDDLRRGGCTA